jgi:transcriptional regulator with XRE-family HTH domain
MAESIPAADLDSVGNAWILLRRIEEHPKQEALATASGLDAGTLSAFKNNKGAVKISNLRLLLRALNLKLVSADSRCVKESTFRELTKLAGRALLEQPQLTWDENE